MLNLDAIRTDGGTQPRAGIDYEAVDDYTEGMMSGTVFPSVVVFYDGTRYWLADGFHRYKAAEQARASDIACEVHQGTQQDAQWYSFGANKTNGIRRTNQDKQRAVKAALTHPKSAGLSDHQIAKHIGVDQKTVSNWRGQLAASKELPKMDSRTVTRNGRTYQQNVSNIGRAAAPPPVAPAPPLVPFTIPAMRDSVPTDLGQGIDVAPVVEQTPARAQPTATQQVSAPVAAGTQWCTRVVRACMEIANCPVSAKELATLIAQTNTDSFNHLEKAHESLADILNSRQ